MSNVVLFMSDEHNPRISVPYGHATVRTPSMARLAERGTLYENAYCPSPLCLPCRSAFFSGRRVQDIQVYNNCLLELDPTIPTYGRILKEQGVHTAHMGKTHAFADGEELGFSEISLYENTYWAWPGDPYFRRRPFAVKIGAHERADGFGPRDPLRSHEGADRVRIDSAVRRLEQHGQSMEQPWVLSVNTISPHFPHVAGRDYWDLYHGVEDLPTIGPEAESANHPYAKDLRRHFETDLFTEEQIRGLRHGYLACVTFVDDQLGRLMDALERRTRDESSSPSTTVTAPDPAGT